MLHFLCYRYTLIDFCCICDEDTDVQFFEFLLGKEKGKGKVGVIEVRSVTSFLSKVYALPQKLKPYKVVKFPRLFKKRISNRNLWFLVATYIRQCWTCEVGCVELNFWFVSFLELKIVVEVTSNLSTRQMFN